MSLLLDLNRVSANHRHISYNPILYVKNEVNRDILGIFYQLY